MYSFFCNFLNVSLPIIARISSFRVSHISSFKLATECTAAMLTFLISVSKSLVLLLNSIYSVGRNQHVEKSSIGVLKIQYNSLINGFSDFPGYHMHAILRIARFVSKKPYFVFVIVKMNDYKFVTSFLYHKIGATAAHVFEGQVFIIFLRFVSPLDRYRGT